MTARAASAGSSTALTAPESTDVGPAVTDARIRRATLASAEDTLGTRPLVRTHAPETGLRPVRDVDTTTPVSRTDCGWLV